MKTSQFILVRDNNAVVLLDGTVRVVSCTSKHWDSVRAFGLSRFGVTVTAIPQILSDESGKKLAVLLWGLSGRAAQSVVGLLVRWVALGDDDLLWLYHRGSSTYTPRAVTKFLHKFRKFRKLNITIT